MINQTYILNMIPGGIQPRIHVSQYDAGSRTLVFQLFQGDGGNGTEFEIPQGATVTIDGTKKQDKKSFSYICTYTGNSVTVTVSQQMTAACGEVECQLTVNKSGAVLGSANFLLVVEHAVLPEDADLSKTEIASLETWKNQALQAAEQAEASETSAAASASAASDSANAAKGSAAEAKESQTAAQASQEAAAQARTAAETAKTAAESAQAQAETALAGAQQAQSAAQQSATSAAGSASAAESSMQSAANAQQSAEAANASAESAATQAVTSASDAEKSASEAASAAAAAVAGKADKAQPSAANNVALLSDDGNLLDSGKQLTPESIGAAPAGYGLGGNDATQLADVPENESGNKDLNLAVNNGWYYIYNSQNYDNFPGTSEGGPNSGYHVMRVDAFRTITQTVYFAYQDWTGCVATRYWYHGTQKWSEWEWANPPMVPGVLYRTTERFNRWQPVYIIAISCGTMPDANSTKTVAHGVSGISAIVSKGGYMSVSGSTPISIPFASTTTNYCNLGVDYQNIRIVAGSTSLTGYTDSVVWFKCTLSS